MKISLGFGTCFEKKVCQLKKALYKLKQSQRAWFGRFEKVMIFMGYRQSQGDRYFFIYQALKFKGSNHTASVCG